MKKMRCNACKKTNQLRYWHTKDGWLCAGCYGTPIIAPRLGLQGKTFIKGYGMVSKARLDEMDRRVILPYKKGDGIQAGQYYLGRRGENGKIQEGRKPDYYK